MEQLCLSRNAIQLARVVVQTERGRKRKRPIVASAATSRRAACINRECHVAAHCRAHQKAPFTTQISCLANTVIVRRSVLFKTVPWKRFTVTVLCLCAETSTLYCDFSASKLASFLGLGSRQGSSIIQKLTYRIYRQKCERRRAMVGALEGFCLAGTTYLLANNVPITVGWQERCPICAETNGADDEDFCGVRATGLPWLHRTRRASQIRHCVNKSYGFGR